MANREQPGTAVTRSAVGRASDRALHANRRLAVLVVAGLLAAACSAHHQPTSRQTAAADPTAPQAAGPLGQTVSDIWAGCQGQYAPRGNCADQLLTFCDALVPGDSALPQADLGNDSMGNLETRAITDRHYTEHNATLQIQCGGTQRAGYDWHASVYLPSQAKALDARAFRAGCTNDASGDSSYREICVSTPQGQVSALLGLACGAALANAHAEIEVAVGLGFGLGSGPGGDCIPMLEQSLAELGLPRVPLRYFDSAATAGASPAPLTSAIIAPVPGVPASSTLATPVTGCASEAQLVKAFNARAGEKATGAAGIHCTRDWAVAGMTVAGNSAIALFYVDGNGTWTWVQKDKICSSGGAPAAIYQEACNSG
jgi:hypothetical protein